MKITVNVDDLKTEMHEALDKYETEYDKLMKLYLAKLEKYVEYVRKEVNQSVKGELKYAPNKPSWQRDSFIDTLKALNAHTAREIVMEDREYANIRNGDELMITISEEEKDGFERIHDWDHYTRAVLNNILLAIEKKQRLGYFDSLIDLGTNIELIKMAKARYIDLFNENKNGERFRNPKMSITKEDIDAQNKGGYSKEFKQHMYDLLINDGDTQG